MSNIWNLFWIFIVLVSVLPILQQKIMQAKRFGLIRRLEKKRNSRVITLIHRQETMRFLGFPLMRYIDITDSEEILRAVRLTPDDMPVDMIVHTPGALFYLLSRLQWPLRDTRQRSRSLFPTTPCLAVPSYALLLMKS